VLLVVLVQHLVLVRLVVLVQHFVLVLLVEQQVRLVAQQVLERELPKKDLDFLDQVEDR
jgi:hypothetical protein